MKRFAFLAVSVVAAVVPQTTAACPSLPALRLGDCDRSLKPQDACNVGLLRFDPWVSKYLVNKGLIPPHSPAVTNVPLQPADRTATERVAKHILRQDRGAVATKLLNRTLWYEARNEPTTFTASAPFIAEAVNLYQRAAVIERDCSSFKVESLTKKDDSAEHYALIVLQCQIDDHRTSMLVGVVLKDQKPIRVYNGSIAPVCFPSLQTRKAEPAI